MKLQIRVLRILAVVLVGTAATISSTVAVSSPSPSLFTTRTWFAALQAMPEDLRDLMTQPALENEDSDVKSLGPEIMTRLTELSLPNSANPLAQEQADLLWKSLSDLLGSQGESLHARQLAMTSLRLVGTSSKVATHQLAAMRNLISLTMEPVTGAEFLARQSGIIADAGPELNLETYLQLNRGNYNKEMVVGVATLDWVTSTSDTAGLAAKEFVKAAIGTDKIEATQQYVLKMRETLKHEKGEFSRRFKNEPLFAASTSVNIGTFILGAATGNVILAGVSLWGVIGSRVQTYIPINDMILSVSRLAVQSEGRREVVEKLKGEIEQAQDLPNYLGKIATNTGAAALNCGVLVASVCRERFEVASAAAAEQLMLNPNVAAPVEHVSKLFGGLKAAVRSGIATTASKCDALMRDRDSSEN